MEPFRLLGIKQTHTTYYTMKGSRVDSPRVVVVVVVVKSPLSARPPESKSRSFIASHLDGLGFNEPFNFCFIIEGGSTANKHGK